jgi:gas vesicle protein
MNTLKFLALAGLGVAGVLLLTTDKGKELRGNLADSAGKLGKKLRKNAGKNLDRLNELKDMVSDEIGGLSDEARTRIMKILDESAKVGRSMKASFSTEVE